MTGKYEFSTSMTCCSTVFLPTCGMRGVRFASRLAGEGPHLDGPSAEVCDPRESIEARCGVLGDEGILLGEGA